MHKEPVWQVRSPGPARRIMEGFRVEGSGGPWEQRSHRTGPGADEGRAVEVTLCHLCFSLPS